MTSPDRHAAGGHARAAALSPEARSAIARKAAAARWSNPVRTPTRTTLRHRLDKLAARQANLLATLLRTENEISAVEQERLMLTRELAALIPRE